MSPLFMQRHETVSGLEECVRKNSEHAESQANLGPIPAAPTYLDSFPLSASVYLSAKWDNKGYLRGVTCTVRSVLLLPM